MAGFKTLALGIALLSICSWTPLTLVHSHPHDSHEDDSDSSSSDDGILQCVSCEFSKITKVAGFDTGASGDGDEDCWSSPDTQDTVNCTTSASGYVARCYAQKIRVVSEIIGIQSVTQIQERKCIIRATADDSGAVCLTDAEIADLAEDQSGLSIVSASGSSCACSDEDLCNSAISVQSATLLTAAIFTAVVSFLKHL